MCIFGFKFQLLICIFSFKVIPNIFIFIELVSDWINFTFVVLDFFGVINVWLFGLVSFYNRWDKSFDCNLRWLQAFLNVASSVFTMLVCYYLTYSNACSYFLKSSPIYVMRLALFGFDYHPKLFLFIQLVRFKFPVYSLYIWVFSYLFRIELSPFCF